MTEILFHIAFFILSMMLIFFICGNLTFLLCVLNHDLTKDKLAKEYLEMILMGPIGLFCQVGMMLTDWLDSC